jgi:hypothetical protein
MEKPSAARARGVVVVNHWGLALDVQAARIRSESGSSPCWASHSNSVTARTSANSPRRDYLMTPRTTNPSTAWAGSTDRNCQKSNRHSSGCERCCRWATPTLAAAGTQSSKRSA